MLDLKQGVETIRGQPDLKHNENMAFLSECSHWSFSSRGDRGSGGTADRPVSEGMLISLSTCRKLLGQGTEWVCDSAAI